MPDDRLCARLLSSNASVLSDTAMKNLTAGLKNGEQQSEINQGECPLSQIYAGPARLKQFLCTMTGLSLGVAKALALQFPWVNYMDPIDEK